MIKKLAQSYLNENHSTHKLFESHETQIVIQKSVDFLKSTKAFDMLAQDPYWPKWDGPWWHMLALQEIGAIEAVPKDSLYALLASINQQHLPFFPLKEEQLPENCDPYRQIMCFCALGSVLQLCYHAGINGFKEIKWAEQWFREYLLPDGGYNCDEQSYTKKTPRSSFTSSLPMYEALLLLKPTDSKVQSILMKGASYLEQREFCKSLSKNRVADTQWLTPGFPLFYEYDALRGMQYVLDAHKACEQPLDTASFTFAFERIYKLLNTPETSFRTPQDYTDFSLRHKNKNWTHGKSRSFPLLDWICQSNNHRHAVHLRFTKLCQDLDYFFA